MKLRFAPSPTGYLHIGNIRTALVNWLFTRANNGQFLLRIDDTDLERSKEEYEIEIENDLRWLGLLWNEKAKQSQRFDRYEIAKQKLLANKRLYPCFESEEELEIKRKMLLSRGLPPIYDRAALKLSQEQIDAMIADGKRPHYRFLLNDDEILWNDMVRGSVSYRAKNLGDPILLREDGVPTYTLSSVVDDGELGISHIIRGEDHVTNTAVQVQLFKALDFAVPTFGHLALIRSKSGEMSKRVGGNDIRSLREKGYEPMAICSLLARLGTSQPIIPFMQMSDLADGFAMDIFGRSPANYDEEELNRLNHKIVSSFEYEQVKDRLPAAIDENFWNSVRANLSFFNEIFEWHKLCNEQITPIIDEPEFIKQALDCLPDGEFNNNSFALWMEKIKEQTGRKGKMLFMPIRKALTALEHGPELPILLPLIGRKEVIRRLLCCNANNI